MPVEEEKSWKVKIVEWKILPSRLKLLPIHNARWRMIQRAYKIMRTGMLKRTLFRPATPKVLYMKCELENY